MQTTPPETALLEVCPYCGQENSVHLSVCAGCGTSLTKLTPEEERAPKRRSKGAAVILVLIFGPIGLFYVRAYLFSLTLVLIGVVLYVAKLSGLWSMIGARIFCALWVYHFLSEMEEPPGGKQDPQSLLNRAANLERYNVDEAIAAYEEIIHKYPNTAASEEAQRNITTLRKGRKAC